MGLIGFPQQLDGLVNEGSCWLVVFVVPLVSVGSNTVCGEKSGDLENITICHSLDLY